MNIGGFQKFTLTDFPNKISAIVFTNGCSFKCGFCYNPELVLLPFSAQISENKILAYLKKRQGLLQGVVITGGEPCLQSDLLKFIQKLKALDYKVKLDTNGYHPEMLEKALSSNLVDYIAMDIKAPFKKYSKIVGLPIKTERIKKSIKIILSSNLPYEFRSTIISGLHTKNDILKMAKMIKHAKKYFLQKFVSAPKMINPNFKNRKSLSKKSLQELAKKCEKWVEKCEVR